MFLSGWKIQHYSQQSFPIWLSEIKCSFIMSWNHLCNMKVWLDSLAEHTYMTKKVKDCLCSMTSQDVGLLRPPISLFHSELKCRMSSIFSVPCLNSPNTTWALSTVAVITMLVFISYYSIYTSIEHYFSVPTWMEKLFFRWRMHRKTLFSATCKCKNSQFTYSLLKKRELTIFERVPLPD